MALTPEIQPTPMLPPVVDGWRTFVLEVFSISLPKSWIVIEQASGRADLCQHGFSVIGDQETWMLNLGVHQKKWGA
jgi:hypothetical protein